MGCPEVLRSMAGYDRWATQQMLTSATALTREQFTRNVGLPWGSIRDQLVHVALVSWRWISWADGSMAGPDAYALTLDPAAYPDLHSAQKKLTDVQEQTRTFLARATDRELNRILSADLGHGATMEISVTDVLLQVVLHSMQHRTEIASALTSIGHSPGDIDYIFYTMRRASSDPVSS